MNSKLFIAFILSAGLLLFPSGCKKKTPTLKIGDPAPEITLQYDDGSTVGLQEIIKGKLAVILFWEKGCPYCEREMPKLEPLFKKYQDKGVILAGIHVGAEAEAVQEAVKQNSLTFPMLVDNNASSREIFGLVAVPSIFIIDRNGTVREKILGGLPAEDMEGLITEKL